MKDDKREQLIHFCINAESVLEGVSTGCISETKYSTLTDEELTFEADWFGEMLDK